MHLSQEEELDDAKQRGVANRQERNGKERFGTVPHIVLIDRWALRGMITRLKFHRESILAIAKSRVGKNERCNFKRERERQKYIITSVIMYEK